MPKDPPADSFPQARKRRFAMVRNAAKTETPLFPPIILVILYDVKGIKNPHNNGRRNTKTQYISMLRVSANVTRRI